MDFTVLSCYVVIAFGNLVLAVESPQQTILPTNVLSNSTAISAGLVIGGVLLSYKVGYDRGLVEGRLIQLEKKYRKEIQEDED